MRTLRRLLALRPDERRVLVAAVLLVVAARLSLRLCPYRVVRRLAARLARPTARRRAPAAVIALAVAAAGRRVPGGRNCLAQALAAHVLLVDRAHLHLCLTLGRHGHASRLRLGVARGAAGEFAAHAWVEIDDAVLVGATGRERFTPLPALDGADP